MNGCFIPGLELSGLFYEQAVRPILERHAPGLAYSGQLKYSAALIGPGSEVLGFDTPQSTDHDWGPRLQLFVGERDGKCDKALESRLDALFHDELPQTFCGYPCFYTRNEDGTASPSDAGSGETFHRVVFHTVRGFIKWTLNWDLDTSNTPSAADWLAMPEQVLRSVTSGRVYHDGLGQLEAVRAQLRYYPYDLWLYLLANQWMRISQEEAFMGRCGQVGDDLGSRLVAARLVRDLMRLCFLMERQYAPYIKWFGTAFRQLACAGRLLPLFEQILAARSWGDRERLLVLAYERVAEMHNALGVTAPLATVVSPFHSRAFMVIDADRFVEAIRAAIVDEEVRALPAHLGSVDQFVDSTDAMHREHLDRLRMMYL